MRIDSHIQSHNVSEPPMFCQKLNDGIRRLLQAIQSIVRKVFDYFTTLFSKHNSLEDVTKESEVSQPFEITASIESEEESERNYPGISGTFYHSGGEWEEEWPKQWASNFIRFRSRTPNSYIRSISFQLGPKNKYSLTFIFNFIELAAVPRCEKGQLCAEFLMERGIHELRYPEVTNLKFTGIFSFDRPEDILIALKILEKDNDFPAENLERMRDIAKNDHIPEQYIKRRGERDLYPLY